VAVPRDQLEASVAERVEAAVAAPIAIAAKATLIAPLLAELRSALEREASAQAIGFTTSDLAEAVAAFREGRPPQFQGR
jgi:hypothetical protein